MPFNPTGCNSDCLDYCTVHIMPSDGSVTMHISLADRTQWMAIHLTGQSRDFLARPQECDSDILPVTGKFVTSDRTVIVNILR